jgi:hypothetical protein
MRARRVEVEESMLMITVKNKANRLSAVKVVKWILKLGDLLLP